ncbi:MAG: carboxypeptidase regulatory-like domain-containing protein [Bacteroidota bacterium]
MILHKRSSLAILIFLLVASITFISCESSRVGPELPRPNPEAPAPAPLILSGYVKDAQSLSGIASANVTVSGTSLTTTTDNTGKYSFNVTDVSLSELNVSAAKDGYGFSSSTAEVDKSSYTATVDDILLAKLQATTSTATPTQGAAVDNTNNQSLSNQPLNLTVPPNAVSQNVQVSVASIPAAQVPPPAASTNQTVVTAGVFGPSGIQFQQPVTITFPLPIRKAAGTTFQLMQLNETTGEYTNSGFTATVDASGTQASAQVTHFTIYTLTDNKSTLNLPDATPTVIETVTLSVTATNPESFEVLSKRVSITLSGGSGDVDADWLRDEISNLLGLIVGPYYAEYVSLSFNITDPESEGGKPSWVQNGIIVGPNPGESGDASKRAVYNKNSKTRNGTVSGNTGANQWSRNVDVIEEDWVLNDAESGWFWTPHNQGGIAQGPF